MVPLVHEVKTEGPATHAIVIGVGRYPHLLDGSGPLTPSNEGMGQLTSTTVSARAIATWLIANLNDPNTPLASVCLLLSEVTPTPFGNPVTGAADEVPPATMANVEDAIKEWAERGNQDIRDRLLFFYSGHGMARDPDLALLLEDYGADDANPLKAAISFREFRVGMDKFKATQQCFFLDACRVATERMLTLGYRGEPIFLPDPYAESLGRTRKAPVFYSTLEGADAYSKAGQPSPFADGLIQALSGAGSDDSEGEWQVTTPGLRDAIEFFMERATEQGYPEARVPAADELTTFTIHYLSAKPKSRVLVRTKPVEAGAEARLEYLDADDQAIAGIPGRLGDWLELPVGDYVFRLTFGPGDPRVPVLSPRTTVRPIYRKVTLPVSQ